MPLTLLLPETAPLCRVHNIQSHLMSGQSVVSVDFDEAALASCLGESNHLDHPGYKRHIRSWINARIDFCLQSYQSEMGFSSPSNCEMLRHCGLRCRVDFYRPIYGSPSSRDPHLDDIRPAHASRSKNHHHRIYVAGSRGHRRRGHASEVDDRLVRLSEKPKLLCLADVLDDGVKPGDNRRMRTYNKMDAGTLHSIAGYYGQNQDF